MFIALLICDELESIGNKDSVSENRGKSLKKIKRKRMQEIGQRAVGNWMVKMCSLYTKQKL